MDPKSSLPPSQIHTPHEVLKADHLFNEALFRTVSYTISGLGIGLVASLFFKRKAPVIWFSAGIGGGWGIQEFARSLAAFRKHTA